MLQFTLLASLLITASSISLDQECTANDCDAGLDCRKANFGDECAAGTPAGSGCTCQLQYCVGAVLNLASGIQCVAWWTPVPVNGISCLPCFVESPVNLTTPYITMVPCVHNITSVEDRNCSADHPARILSRRKDPMTLAPRRSRLPLGVPEDMDIGSKFI
eukprot:GEMP01036472.1.p1 GENE.GEMP01036472.1~~GEMP01036472.1.p1  ORF type:complete len:161 (+),score=11.23 GEMP01036472.1:114-596(+)